MKTKREETGEVRGGHEPPSPAHWGLLKEKDTTHLPFLH